MSVTHSRICNPIFTSERRVQAGNATVTTRPIHARLAPVTDPRTSPKLFTSQQHLSVIQKDVVRKHRRSRVRHAAVSCYYPSSCPRPPQTCLFTKRSSLRRMFYGPRTNKKSYVVVASVLGAPLAFFNFRFSLDGPASSTSTGGRKLILNTCQHFVWGQTNQ